MTRSLYQSGSAFHGNQLQGTHPLSAIPRREITNYVSFTKWCRRNYISKAIGRKAIVKKYLIAQRFGGQLWVCANPDCLPELLEYLNIDRLFFDAMNPLIDP